MLGVENPGLRHGDTQLAASPLANGLPAVMELKLTRLVQGGGSEVAVSWPEIDSY